MCRVGWRKGIWSNSLPFSSVSYLPFFVLFVVAVVVVAAVVVVVVVVAVFALLLLLSDVCVCMFNVCFLIDFVD